MFVKNLILVLLGCALTLANPIPKNEKPILQSMYDVNIGLWFGNAHEEIKQTFKQIIRPFEKTYSSLVEAEKNGDRNSIAQIEQLRSVFHEITDKGWEQLSDIEVIILTNAIRSLQNAVQYQEATNNKIDQLQNSVLSGSNGAIPSTENSVSDNVNRRKTDFTGGLLNKVGDAMQDTINSGVENVKGLTSNGLKLAEGIANKFGNNVQEAFNNEKNIIEKAVENVKENVSQGGKGNQYVNQHQGNVYDSKLALEKIAKTLTGAVAVHMNNVHQSFMQWRNIVENFLANGESKFVNKGMGQNIRNRGKLSEIIEGMNNKFQESFGQVQNIAEGIGHGMLSGVAQGIKNVQGTFGKLTDVAEGIGHGILSGVGDGIKHVQGTFGQLLNVAGGIGQGVLSGVGDGMKSVQEKLKNIADRVGNNIQGNFGIKLPNVAENIQGIFQKPNSVGDIEGLVPEQKITGDGRFQKIGQKVGSHIGGNIDKFTNALGGIWQNAANIFGK